MDFICINLRDFLHFIENISYFSSIFFISQSPYSFHRWMVIRKMFSFQIFYNYKEKQNKYRKMQSNFKIQFVYNKYSKLQCFFIPLYKKLQIYKEIKIKLSTVQYGLSWTPDLIILSISNIFLFIFFFLLKFPYKLIQLIPLSRTSSHSSGIFLASSSYSIRAKYKP